MFRNALRSLHAEPEPSFIISFRTDRYYCNGPAQLLFDLEARFNGGTLANGGPVIDQIVGLLRARPDDVAAATITLHEVPFVVAPVFGIAGRVDAYVVRRGELADVPALYRDLSDATLFSQLIDLLPIIVFTVRPSGERDFVNRRFVEYAGLIGQSESVAFEAIVHPDDLALMPRPWEMVQPLAAPRTAEARVPAAAYTAEVRLRRYDGEYRRHVVHVTGVPARDGKVVKWLGTIADTEDLRAAEATVQSLNVELDEWTAELERVLDVVPVGLAIANGWRGDEVRINVTLMRMLGVTEPHVPYGHPALRSLRAADLDQPAETNAEFSLEVDGTRRHLAISAAPLHFGQMDGGAVAAFTDISRARDDAFLRAMVHAAQQAACAARDERDVYAGVCASVGGYAEHAVVYAREGADFVPQGEPPGAATAAAVEAVDLAAVRAGEVRRWAGTHRWIAVPLADARATVTGVLILGRQRDRIDFDDADFGPLVDLGMVLALAVDRMRLLERHGAAL